MERQYVLGRHLAPREQEHTNNIRGPPRKYFQIVYQNLKNSEPLTNRFSWEFLTILYFYPVLLLLKTNFKSVKLLLIKRTGYETRPVSLL